jgi:Protein of unknown function (DUF664)
MASPQVASKELETLGHYLDGQRQHVLGILEGLPEEQLRRPVLPTGWSSLGLVRHLALDVERFWFPGVFAGEPDVVGHLTSAEGTHWRVPEGMTAAEVFAEYRAAIERANSVLAAAGEQDRALEQEPAAWPVEIWPDWRLPDLRHILLHAITEIACHAGHLDAVRELIDGTTWMVEDPDALAVASENEIP